MRNKRWLQILIFAVVIVIGGLTVMNTVMSKEEKVQVGNKAPEFTLTRMDGTTFTLSDYRGKAVVLNFWGTFCPPCVREMPALQKQYESWKDKGVEVIGVNLNESPVTVRAFLEQHSITFPILLDRDEVRKKYKVVSYPTTFYIDANGMIRDIFIGEMQEADIQSRIEKLIRI